MHNRFSFSDLDKLGMDEYLTVVYLVPLILYGLAVAAWNAATGHDMWRAYSETTLLFYMAAHYLMFMSLTGIVNLFW